MLMFSGVALAILALATLVILFLANLQSPTGRTIYPWWPALAIAAASAACFIARHFLHGVAITW